jgi:deoxyribose-phosphate aldolase
MNPLELDQLVREIGDEVLRRLGQAPGGPAAHACACGTASAPQPPSLHQPRGAATSNGTPSQPGLPQRNSSPHSSSQHEIARLINHTLLCPEASPQEIHRLCHEARQYGFASACVQPSAVARAVRELRGTNIKVCTVIGYPQGATLTPVKLAEAELALKLGAHELELAIHPGALQAGDLDAVYTEIRAVAECARAGGAALKVLVEMASLSEQHQVTACALARLAGAGALKTSAGLPGSTTSANDVALAHRIVGGELGIEAAGGIDSYSRFRDMIAAGATRVSSNAGVAIVSESGGA